MRYFVEQKLLNLGTYTTLPFVNRMEIILNDLPVEISCLFLLNEKLTCDKAEILDFCDSIQHVVEAIRGTENEVLQVTQNAEEQTLNRMEIFNFVAGTDSEPESMLLDDTSGPSGSITGRKRGVGKGATRGKVTKRGRPAKKCTAIPEDSESSSYSFLSQVSDSSVSSI